MPKTTPSPRQFVELAQRPDAKWVKIMKPNDNFTKFKLRTASHLYTVIVKDQFARMVIDAMPAELDVHYVEKKAKRPHGEREPELAVEPEPVAE
jgi:hypothetical protein